ncbi:MAG: 3'-5' exonuclease [Verrucomicrobiota bacterium]
MLRLIRQCRFAAIDFESAGATRGSTDTPVQIGLASWCPNAGHHQCFVSYLATSAPIQWSARKIHGIGPADLAGAPPLLSLWPTVRDFLTDSVVVAHGKGTEKRFLRAFPGHGFGPWLDTLLLARALWPQLPDHTLGALCEIHGLTAPIRELVPGKTWHDALFDATASLVLLDFMFVSHAMGDEPLDVILQPDTSTWHRIKTATTSMPSTQP